MPWIVQRQIMTALIGLPQRYIYSTVTNMKHRRWRGNWLSPVPFLSFKIKCDFFPLQAPLKKHASTNSVLYGRYVTDWVTYWVHKLEGLKIRSDIWDRKDRKRKQSREAAVCWEGWSRLHVNMRENMENLFVRVRWTDLWGQIIWTNSAVVDVLSCQFKSSLPLFLHDRCG